MKRVFISYGAPDVVTARQVARGLERSGFVPLLFEQDARPGQRIHRFMRDSIETADAVILLCSRASLVRAGVINELEQSLRKEAKLEGRTLLYPVALDDFVFDGWTPSYLGFAGEVRDRFIIRLPTNYRSAAFKSALNTLLRTLHEDLTQLSVREISGDYVVDLQDPKGHLANMTYTRVFQPIFSDLNYIDVQNFTSSGRVRFLSANPGRLETARDDGGLRRMRFAFDPPLEKGKNHSFVAKLEAIDCHLERTETALFTNTRNYGQISISVNFPASRRPISARLIKALGSDRSELPKSQIRRDPTRLHVTIQKPQPYATYILEWDW